MEPNSNKKAESKAMKRETGILLFLVFTNLCWAAAIVLYDRDVKNIKAELRACAQKEIEIGFVIDAKDRTWVEVKRGKNIKAISCDGDSISFTISNGDIDTVFTKVTISDLIRAKQ